jgi:solute carrier family 25 carnitine/acylcarnitine transporter 20/29
MEAQSPLTSHKVPTVSLVSTLRKCQAFDFKVFRLQTRTTRLWTLFAMITDYIYRETVAGASAGVVGTVLGYPLDVLKTRQQVSGLSLLSCMQVIKHESGLWGFYKGMASPLLSLTILNTLNFSTYSLSRSWLRVPDTFNTLETGLNLRIPLAGSLVGPLSSLISTPFELVKTQMQLAARNVTVGSSNPAQPYKNAVGAAAHITKAYGMKALYRGFMVNTTREMVFLGTYFFVYEHVKSLQLHVAAVHMSPSIAVPVAGGLAGALGWLISFPLDCVKSNIQGVNLATHSNIRVDTLAVARDLIRSKGVLGLYSGVVPSILRAFLVSSSRFSAYETTMWLLRDK